MFLLLLPTFQVVKASAQIKVIAIKFERVLMNTYFQIEEYLLQIQYGQATYRATLQKTDLLAIKNIHK